MDCLLNIADICFRIRAKRSDFYDPAWNENAYRPFLPDSVPDAHDFFEIDIIGKDLDLPDGAKKIFDCEGPWVLYSSNGDYIFANLSPNRAASPAWTAHIRLEENKTEIFCNPASLNPLQRKHRYNPISYPFDQILTSLFLAENRGAILHSAGWIIGGSAWMFAGQSGAGKSTISRLIAANTGMRPISDDRVIVRKIGGEFFAYGTPWTGEAGFAENRRAPLRGLFFLEKGEVNQAVRIGPRETIARLVQVVSVPWYDREKTEFMLTFLDSLLATVPTYRLVFKKDVSVLEELKKAMEVCGRQ